MQYHYFTYNPTVEVFNSPNLPLQGIFGSDRIRGFSMGKFLKGHLTKPS